MNFVSDAIAEIEGLLDVNRDFCKKQVGNPKGFPSLPKADRRNKVLFRRRRWRKSHVQRRR
jgi:hypothetical protein